MHPFFAIIDRAGIGQQRLADRIGVDKSHFTRVKQGQRKVTLAFAERATAALYEIGLRQWDGSPYTIDALFFLPELSTVVHNSSPHVDAEQMA